MTEPPLILVTPATEKAGNEFHDRSISLSQAYLTALMAAGAVPVAMPTTTSREVVAACLRRVDGVLMSGGEDINPRLYAKRLSSKLRKTVRVTPDGGARDLREVMLVGEVFRQRKPLLAICRGHQILNVALGGTLFVDIASEVPSASNHRRHDRKNGVVHEAYLTGDALLARITGKRTLGVNSTHHQAVARPADPLVVTGRSGDGIVESMQLKLEAMSWLPFLLSVQFHPERLSDRYPEHRAIFSAFVRACALNRKK